MQHLTANKTTSRRLPLNSFENAEQWFKMANKRGIMWARQLRSKCNLSMPRVSWQRSVILLSRLQNKVTHATFLNTIRFSSDFC